MKFHEQLNEYIQRIDCTAKELSDASGLSPATLSRYRSGERVPGIDTKAFRQLTVAIVQIAEKKQIPTITADLVAEGFRSCSDIVTVNRKQLCRNFDVLLSLLNINISKLCQSINYDSSTIFRFRNGTRQPADPAEFAAAVAKYIVYERNEESDKTVLAELLNCPADEIADPELAVQQIQNWLLSEGQDPKGDSVFDFLAKLDDFNLNEYIKAIHFDELKVPISMPFSLPTSKTYLGLKEMMASELDFLKATVLSKSSAPVIMYSDMPMGERAKDPEFPKKWMFGMAMMLKKGLHLHQIHNLDRSLEDMMLGLESWIPMYMTGQISPYYLKGVQNNVFLHFLKVSGAAALSGEAINGFHAEGKYYLTKSKEEVAYYQKRARELLKNAQPLMEIYREDKIRSLNAFLLSDAETPGKRRNILSSLPLYTMDAKYLEQLFVRHAIPEQDRTRILEYASAQRKMHETLLKNGTVADEIALPNSEEFERFPMLLSLSNIFYETSIPYTWQEYQEHLEQTRAYAASHPGYTLNESSGYVFRNLQIHIHEGKWVMVSKNKTPAIHFVIHHPRLCEAIESFVPPVIEA